MFFQILMQKGCFLLVDHCLPIYIWLIRWVSRSKIYSMPLIEEMVTF